MGNKGDLVQFHWEPQPRAQALVNELVNGFLSRSPGALELAQCMRDQTGTRFNDWVDHIQAPRSEDLRQRLLAVGFSHRPIAGAPDRFVHEGAIFPEIVLVDGTVTRLAVKVDSVADFLAAWQIPHDHASATGPIEGEPLAPLRRAVAFADPNAEMLVVERHGYRGYEVVPPDHARAANALKHHEALRRRKRDFASDKEGFAHLGKLLDAAIADLGRDYTCDIFFFTEREYWQRRNRAGQVQKMRQDKLGLGWANHDHHTYRSSRHCFPDLIAVLEKLGFGCRERFYAGAEAGWGAQVVEQPVTGITIFADVDMSPEELLGDFAHKPMPERKELGTVGLWCALHGEAILQAGMHHLECQFDWYALEEQLENEESIKTMDPFTTFPFLRQAFTEGERWQVPSDRIDRALANGQITPAQAEQFRTQGAIGSHLENLERNDGYKGFNQHGVSQIIAKTDPRKQLEQAAH